MRPEISEMKVSRARVLTSRWSFIVLLCLLAAAVICLAFLYPLATRRMVASHDQPLVERARQEAAVAFGMTPEEIARKSFPVAIRLSDSTCVELRPLHEGDGSYLACYDNRTGHVLEERVGSASFGT